MKKQNQVALKLNKKSISKFQVQYSKEINPKNIVGGLMDSCTWICDDDVL